MPRRHTIAILVGGTALVAASVLGLSAFSTPATSIETGEFNIHNASITSEDGVIQDIFLETNMEYSYTSNMAPDSATIELQVGDGAGTYETITTHEIPNPTAMESGTLTLNGSVFNSSAYSASDFEVSTPGESVSKTVPVRVLITVSKTGEPDETAMMTDQMTLTVNRQDQLTVSFTMGGSGRPEIVD